MLKLLILLMLPQIGYGQRVLDADAIRNNTNLTGYLNIPLVTPTANRVCVIDGTQTISSSSVTDTELDYLSGVTSAIQTQLNGKEPGITAGTTSQYWRGDKTFQTLDTLAVPENTNLYFTNGRAQSAISATSPLTYGSGVVGCQASSGSQAGCLSSSDWNTFNNKQNLLSLGNLTDTGTDGITVTGGTGAVVGSGTSLSQHVADSTHNGYLGSSDWSTFNAKEPAISAGTTSQYWRGDKSFQTLNTTAVPEGSNLYYTQGRFDSAFGAKTTTNLTEGLNLYYTAARFNSAFSGKSTTDLTEGSNLYYTTARFNTDFGGRTTTNLTEGSNLYYTQGRFDSAFGAKTTSNLVEGSNLYYTDARARGAVSATSPLSYSSSTGVFSIPVATTSVDGYLSATDWTTFNNKAPTASPAFTGVPTAPTAAVGTSTTQLATTAFVLSQGFQGATGSMPFAHQSSTSVVTSATTTYVTAISTTITTTASSAPVYAKATGTFTVTGAVPTVLKYRVSVNGVAGQEQLLSLTALTTNYTAAVQYISAALAAGTYTVLFEIARNSGTGTVSFFEGTLDAIALQGTESNGITTLTGDVTAGPGSGSQAATIANLAVTNAKIANTTIDLTTKVTGLLPMANAGTNANLTAANGAIPYSTASAFALLAPGTTGQLLRSGGAGAPTWTSETFPSSTTINQILYSSAANVVSGLATANTGALVTSSTGVPSIASGSTANRVLRTNGTTVSFAQLNLGTDVVAVANQRVPFGNGTGLVTDANFIYDTTNTILSVGGSGTAKINAVNASGSHTALQAYNSSAGNAFQATNVSAYTAALISRQNNATTGASIGFEFGRGTAASPTGALNGDQIGVIVATPDASSGAAFGYSGAITFVATEDATTTATGGDLVLATTPNTTLLPIERFRIKQSGQTSLVNSHLKSTQTTAPTAAADAGAGTGASCSVSNATDNAGKVSVTTGAIGLSTGSYCTVTFNTAYAVAPICTLTPAGSTLSTSVYVTSTTTTMSINFALAGGISSTYVLNYNCIETQ